MNPPLKIRPATPDDAPVLIGMLEAFHADSCYASMVEFCPVSLIETLKHLSTSNKNSLFIGEVNGSIAGMAAAISSPHWGNSAHITGQELFWYCRPAYRKSGIGLMLLRGLEQWALDIGCTTFSLASTANLRPKALGRFYRMRGYAPQDVFYSKRMAHAK